MNVDIFFKRFVNIELNIFRKAAVVQIRNSSWFMQQSAKFIPNSYYKTNLSKC